VAQADGVAKGDGFEVQAMFGLLHAHAGNVVITAVTAVGAVLPDHLVASVAILAVAGTVLGRLAAVAAMLFAELVELQEGVVAVLEVGAEHGMGAGRSIGVRAEIGLVLIDGDGEAV